MAKDLKTNKFAKVDFTTDRRNLRYARVLRKKYNIYPGRKSCPIGSRISRWNVDKRTEHRLAQREGITWNHLRKKTWKPCAA